MSDKKNTPDVEEFLTLARLALAERAQDVQLFLSKIARKIKTHDPNFSNQLSDLIKNASSRSSSLRRENAIPLPVDSDSRLHLIKIEQPSPSMLMPVLSSHVTTDVMRLIKERKQLEKLTNVNLEPTRSALFVGPPGVGKTMTARWIASQLDLPLLTLDLSAVMSSFLGRTGNNVRTVLDYAKRQSCVLLLDELDAIAKRRDDATEIGELKRLVTVLLQEIDEWPSHGLLLSATNHPELLDPAIWRRFDLVIAFPPPSNAEIKSVIKTYAGEDTEELDPWLPILITLLSNRNLSDTQKQIMSIRRSAIINESSIADEVSSYLKTQIDGLSRADKIALAENLSAIPNMSQRRVHELTGVSRDTLRKRTLKSTTEAHNG